MRNRSTFPLAFLLCLFLCESAAGAEDVAFHWLSPCAKPGALQPERRFLSQFEMPAEIHVARGESESIQLLVVAPAGGLKNLRLRIGEFSNESKLLIAGKALQWNFVGFVTTKEPYYGTLRVGEWPDPLLPDRAVDLGPGRAQPVWIEVANSADAVPGRYEGKIVVEADGLRRELSLAVTIWDFAVPAEPVLPSSFLLYPRFVHEYHDVVKGSLEADTMLRSYYAAMLAHRVMPTHVAMGPVGTRPRINLTDDGELRGTEFRAFDAQVGWAMARGQTHFGLEGPRRAEPRSEAWYGAVGTHVAQKGWEGRFYTYLFDETYEGVDEMTRLVRRNAPGLRNLITRLPADGYPAVDWWCPRLGDAMMHKVELDAWLAANGRSRADTWVYTAGNAGGDVPALHLDVPGIEARITPLAVWREGFAGLLFWCVNYWTVDPWQDPMVYPRQNGNGVLLYPGQAGPVISQRLKLLRDGFEDVAYASLLEASDDPLAGQVLAAMPMAGALDWDRDVTIWRNWRILAGDLLGGEGTRLRERIAGLKSREESSGAPPLAVGDPADICDGWRGGREKNCVPSDAAAPVLRFTLDAEMHKLRRRPAERNWSGVETLVLDLTLIEGEATLLNVKLSSGLFTRREFTWELHMAPGERRRVRVPVPHERIDTESVRELTIFLWEPDAPRRFELAGAWLE